MTDLATLLMPGDINPQASITELEGIRKDWWDAACERDIQHACLLAAIRGDEVYRSGRTFMVRVLDSVVIEKTDTSRRYDPSLGMATRSVVVNVYRRGTRGFDRVDLAHFYWEHLGEDDACLWEEITSFDATYDDGTFIIPGKWWSEVHNAAMEAKAVRAEAIRKEQEEKRLRLLNMLKVE